MPENMRPDVCKVVMGWPWGIERDVMYIYPYPDHPFAWREPLVKDYINMILSRGGRVVIVWPNKRMAIKGHPSSPMAVIGTEEEFEAMFA